MLAFVANDIAVALIFVRTSSNLVGMSEPDQRVNNFYSSAVEAGLFQLSYNCVGLTSAGLQ